MDINKEEILSSPLAARIFLQATKKGRLGRRMCESLADAGLLTRDDGQFISYSPLPKIQDVAEQSVSKDDVGGDTNAFNALWLFLMTEGTIEEMETYGAITPEMHDIAQAVHLGLCGLDEERSTMPVDTAWSHFVNTYAENTETHGIEGQATCQCNEVNDMMFSYEFAPDGPGLASVFIKVASY